LNFDVELADPMDDLELLQDDHSLLGSQVVHVVTLIRSLGDGHQPAVALFAEVVRQMEILRNQLLSHFAFEEDEAFPRLNDKYPEIRSELVRLLAQHDSILGAFDVLRSGVCAGPSTSITQGTAENCALFESAFELHAAQESTLFRQLPQQPREIAPEGH
jgi:iron-sulfur cluster repair protein YtfE (RIC family)